MMDPIQLTPYFESEKEAGSGILSAGADYVAGLRGPRHDVCAVHFKLTAEAVERVVLARAQLSLELDPEGLVYIQPMGLSEEAIAAAMRAGHLPSKTLRSLVEASLAPEDLAMEDAPLHALTSLRGHLQEALTMVDRAIETWRKR